MVVDRFFIWVAEASSEQKLAAVDALVAAYFDGRIAEAEREAIEAALMLVAEDPDLAVRRRLAEVLAEIDTAPRHLLLALLDDRPEVAVVVAARSEALIDAELVDLVAHGVDDIRRAVARRRRVGPTVAVALAEAGDRAACVALLTNAGAEIPPIALERLVERFGEFAEIRKALLARPHVPITVRHRVLEKLSEAIENLVVVKSWMGPEKAGAAVRESCEKATIALAGNATAAEAVVLVEHLRRTGRLTTRLMLRAACIGDLRFVEEALALLADVPTSRVAALVADGRESALHALYRRAAMPDRAWPAFHAAIEVHRELLAETGGLDGRPGDRARFARRLVERVLTRFTAFERRDADDLLVLLRRYAADAARDHVRNVMAERMADAALALAAPVAAPVVAEPSPIDAAILDAVAAELGVGLFDAEPVEPAVVPAEAAEASAETARPVAEPSDPARDLPAFTFEFDATESLAVVEDEFAAAEGFGGLFSHVRLEDLPPDWHFDEVAAEDLWSDAEIAVRRSIVPDLRLVVDEEPALPIFESLDPIPAVPIETPEPAAAAAPEPVAIVDEAGVADVEPSEAPAVSETETEAETPPASDTVDAAAPTVEAIVTPIAPPPVVETGDEFIARLESELDALLGPLPKSLRAA